MISNYSTSHGRKNEASCLFLRVWGLVRTGMRTRFDKNRWFFSQKRAFLEQKKNRCGFLHGGSKWTNLVLVYTLGYFFNHNFIHYFFNSAICFLFQRWVVVYFFYHWLSISFHDFYCFIYLFLSVILYLFMMPSIYINKKVGDL